MSFLFQADIKVAAVCSSARNADSAVVASAGGNAHIDGLLLITDVNGEFSGQAPMHVDQRKSQFGFGICCGPACARTAGLSAAAHPSHASEQHFKEIAE